MPTLPLSASTPPARPRRPLVGLHGEHTDWTTSASLLYHLGHGVRSYDPTLQRFLSLDPYSPFSGGGVNPYAFCRGDPVNRTDHSGYMSVSAATGIGLGILGILLGIVSLGMSVMVAMTMMGTVLAATSALLGLVSSATGIAAAVVEDRDPGLARALGWASLGLATASAIVGLIGPALLFLARCTGRLTVGRLSGINNSRFEPARSATSTMPAQGEIDFIFRSHYRNGAFLMTHGEPGTMQNAVGAYLNPTQLADELAQLPAYQSTAQRGPLYLMSCGAATSRTVANAAYIADTLGRDVYAFASPFTLNGSHPIALPVLHVGRGSTWGKLIRFSPM
ncbi:RHS repeat-associated core domain-containing protein [Microvirgula aerodenitrificans]|uniref:RHS repeat-associated core domain-containing protein n=2 Tax=Microvirgula aerodenitrificans TaxID=57480 RepID=UPI0028E81967|nr:RHS repeat-associated core domain-containing protein [Microvirgula aerodenitrificans]